MILEMLLIALFVFIILIKKMNVLSSSFAVFMLVGVLILLYANLQNTIIFASYNSRFDFEYTLYKLLVSVRVNSIFAVKWLFVSGVVVYLTSDYLMIALCFEKKLTFSKLMLLILFCVLGAIFIYFNSPKMSTYIYELSYKIKFYIRLANSIKIFNFLYIISVFSTCIYIIIKKKIKTEIIFVKEMCNLFLVMQVSFIILISYLITFSSLLNYMDPMRINDLYGNNGDYDNILRTAILILLLVVFLTMYVYLDNNRDARRIKKRFACFSKNKKIKFDDVSHLFHSYKNALNAIYVLANKAEMCHSTDEEIESIRNIKDIVDEFSKRAIKLLEYYKGKPMFKEDCRLSLCIKTAIDICNTEGIDITFENLNDADEFWGDESALIECFTNILTNSIEELVKVEKQDKWVQIKTFNQNDIICVQVEDNGPGISTQNLSKIFRVGYTTKCTYRNWGMGLSQSRAIARKHNGVINVKSKKNKGTKVQIAFIL